MQWEYKTITGHSSDWEKLVNNLNLEGMQGWEAVGLSPSKTYDLGGLLPWDNKGSVVDRPFVVLLKRAVPD